MNCRSAQRLLSAERDGALRESERANLEEHLAGCSDCRRARMVVAAAVDSWRAASARVAVPDADRAWQDVRRKIRTSAPADARGIRALPRWALPATVAAAVIFAATLAPEWLRDRSPAHASRQEVARADFVETPDGSSSLVYVDDKSGWLVVWAVSNNDKDKM